VHLKLTAEAKGTVSIAFYSAEDLERIMELIMRHERSEF
jgi:hypothetical protein